MLNPKFSIVFSVCGFVLSFLIALISGASFAVILLRALVVAAVFFGLSVLIYIALVYFLPELLQPADQSTAEYNDTQSGSIVDITVGGNETPVAPDGVRQNSDDAVVADTDAPADIAAVLDDTATVDTLAAANEDAATAGRGASTAATVAEAAAVSAPFTDTAQADDGLSDLPDFDAGTLPLGNEATAVSGSPDSGTPITEAATMAKAIQTMLAHDN